MKYAVLVETMRYIPSDGHEYPAYHEKFTEFVPFTTEQEMLKWVERSKGKTYIAIQFSELEIVTEVKVKQTVVQRKLSESDLYTNTVMSLCD